MLKIDRTIVATGCFVDNHITRIYVLPEHQKKGYGTFIMKNIEVQISEKYDKEYLDASLPAAALYEKLGFSTVKHECYPVENGVILAYEVKKAYIMNMYTAPEYRRQGIAFQTLDLLVSPALAASIEALRASRLVCAVIFRIESASTPIWSTTLASSRACSRFTLMSAIICLTF